MQSLKSFYSVGKRLQDIQGGLASFEHSSPQSHQVYINVPIPNLGTPFPSYQHAQLILRD